MNSDCFHTSDSIFEEVHLLPNIKNVDERGSLVQAYSLTSIASLKGWGNFRIQQQNIVKSNQGSIRGMHRTKNSYPTRKILTCLSGEIKDVLLDTCKASVTFGEYKSFILDGSKPEILCIPSCLAHGYQTISQESIVTYLLDQEYDPTTEINLNPFDPTISHLWDSPFILSDKDSSANSLRNHRTFD